VKRPRGQSVADADRDVRQYLVRVAAMLGDLLGDRLAGLYVYGSLATGSFQRDRSDVNLLVLVSRTLDAVEREHVARLLLRLSDERPMRGGIDVDVVAQAHAQAFCHPVPYEVHYDGRMHEAIRRRRVAYAGDRSSVELAARIAAVRERGVTLVGSPAASVFAPVPWYAYVGALESALRSGRAIVEKSPGEAVLQACRVLLGATSQRMNVPAKDESALWALENVPRIYRSTINDALALYLGNKDADDVVFTPREVIAFREYVRQQCRPAFERASQTGSDDE